MSQSIVTLRGADKYYRRGKSNEIHVMDQINLELPERGMVAVFGPSGCGKTTLLNAIGGLDAIGSGSIELFGQNIREDTDTLRNRYVGYIFQNYNLNVQETVYENVADALRLCGMTEESAIKPRVMAALSGVDMDKYRDRLPDTLSGGQQQRVAIARAIVKSPAIILADEPTGNLDEQNTVMVMDILKELSKTRLVLLVTHEANLVDYYCDRVIEIVDGRVVSDRENEGANGYVERSKNDIYLGELEKTEINADGVQIECYGDPREVKLRIVCANGKLYLKSETPSLRVLDESAEIRLVDGVFHNTPRAEGESPATGRVDMSAFTPVEGSRYGRLYHFRNALGAAWRENFARKKKGAKMLRISLFLLSVVLVFMAATGTASLRQLAEIRGEHSEQIFFVPIEPTEDYSAVWAHIGEHGMDYARLIGDSYLSATDYLTFRTTAFMTASGSQVSARGYVLDMTHADELPLVCGTTELSGEGDIVITTAFADELIESATVSYIEDYADLIGLVSSHRLSVAGKDIFIRVVGVVDSEESNFYLSSLSAAFYVLQNQFYLPVYPVSLQSFYKGEVKDGEAVFLPAIGTVANIGEGEDLMVLGRSFRVTKVNAFEQPKFEIIPDDDGGSIIIDYDSELTEEEIKDNWLLDYEVGTDYEMLYENCLVVSDADYIRLAYSAGKTDDRLAVPFYTYKFDGGAYHSHHLMIHASDPEAAEAYLSDAFGDALITPSAVMDEMLLDYRDGIVATAVTLAVLLVLMCLCIFGIMRSSFMSRVKEVGILRSIGVTKRNLLFRFAVETALLMVLTVLLGYLLSAWFIVSLSDAPLFSSVFYFPAWLSIAMLAVIAAAGLFFGVLPAMLLLRKTPSEILAKYDV